MSSRATSDPDAGENSTKALGVKFAESAVGRPIIAGLLFITGSFWLMLTAVGAVLVLVAVAIRDGVMAGVIGIFGLSGVAIGLFGYGVYLWFVNRRDERS